MSTRLEQRVIAKTASFTLSPSNGFAPGTVITNRGAVGAITATLLAASRALIGVWYELRVLEDQSMILAAAAVNTLVTLGDVAADNVGFQIANKKVGRRLQVFCDGTSWFAVPAGALDGFCIDGVEYGPTLANVTLSSPVITTPTQTITVEAVAAAGGDQAAATAIADACPKLAHCTGADGAKGVKLPAAAAGKIVYIKNADAANAILKVYPAVGDAINAIAADGALSMAAKTAAVFVCLDGTTWFSFSLLPS